MIIEVAASGVVVSCLKNAKTFWMRKYKGIREECTLALLDM
jgi:hypothetical protein